MPRKKIHPPISREYLLQVMEKTHNSARFVVGVACREDDSFLTGLCLNRSEFWSKEKLMQAIIDSPLKEFCGNRNLEDHLVIDRHLFVYRGSINKAQTFPETTDVDGFTHAAEKGTPYYDIYFRFDHGAKTVTFALGSRRKTLTLVENTEWAWKLTRSSLLCIDSEYLEQRFLDGFWDGIAVKLGRKALGIKDVI